MGGMVNTHILFPWKICWRRQLKRDVDGSKVLHLKRHDMEIFIAFKWLKMQPNGGIF
jgi:hypothetical protein